MVFGSSSRSRSTSDPAWSNVESLCAFEFISRRDYSRLLPNDMRLNILSESVSIALDILQSRQGFSALSRLASYTLTSTLDAPRRNADPRACAGDFITRVRDALPVIFVRDLGNINGRTTREHWNQPPGRSFVAQRAAVIEINTRVSVIFIR